MNTYQLVSTVVALLLYVPLARQILLGQVKQNIATWILWGTLDLLAAASLIVQHGNWFLPAAYVAGCILIVICLVKTKIILWGRFENICCFMVVICLVGWMLSGPRLATILSTTGVVLAGLPQVKDAYKNPEEMPLFIYVGYTIVNTLSAMGGSGWTVEERLYPAACAVLCLVIVGCASRRFVTPRPHLLN